MTLRAHCAALLRPSLHVISPLFSPLPAQTLGSAPMMYSGAAPLHYMTFDCAVRYLMKIILASYQTAVYLHRREMELCALTLVPGQWQINQSLAPSCTGRLNDFAVQMRLDGTAAGNSNMH